MFETGEIIDGKYRVESMCSQSGGMGEILFVTAWGTHGYIPPEFQQGGFKHADATGDIYMLGKTFYVLLTGREPAYLMQDGVPHRSSTSSTGAAALPKGHATKHWLN